MSGLYWRAVVLAVLHELKGRKGIGDELAQIEQDVWEELVDACVIAASEAWDMSAETVRLLHEVLDKLAAHAARQSPGALPPAPVVDIDAVIREIAGLPDQLSEDNSDTDQMMVTAAELRTILLAHSLDRQSTDAGWRQGAEAMREAAAKLADDPEVVPSPEEGEIWIATRIAAAIRSAPIPAPPSDEAGR